MPFVIRLLDQYLICLLNCVDMFPYLSDYPILTCYKTKIWIDSAQCEVMMPRLESLKKHLAGPVATLVSKFVELELTHFHETFEV